MVVNIVRVSVCFQREITRKLTFPKQPTNPFLEMVKFLLERIAPVHIDSEAIRSVGRHWFIRRIPPGLANAFHR